MSALILDSERPSSFTRLPHELLTAIVNEFDVFVTDESDPESTPGDQPTPKALHPDIAAFRSVCRLFRTLVYGMRFWYADDVHVTALLPSTRTQTTAADDDGYIDWQDEVDELTNHLKDELFVRAIEKRTKWRFKHTPLLLAIFEHVPSFRRNVTSVVLNFPAYPNGESIYPKSAITASIAILGNCPNIASVEIVHLREMLSLKLLAISCPSLKSLRIMDMGQDYDGGELGGNLEGLTTLEEVDIRGFDPDIRETPFLPVSSVATLTRLSLLSRWGFDSAYTSWDVLDNFVNLKSLSISPLICEITRWIPRAKNDILDLRFILIDRGDIGDFWSAGDINWIASQFDELMSSNCLRGLREFRFGVAGFFLSDDQWIQLANTLLRAILNHQVFLEKLVLTASSHHASMALLPKLEHLKTLRWHELDVPSKRQFSASEVKRRIHAAFESSPAEPVIEVFPHYDFQYPQFGLLVD